MEDIDFSGIEKKWQDRWEKEKVFCTQGVPSVSGKVDEESRKPYYVLEMFAYPSGEGLHMGHAFNFVIGDVFARYKIMNGFDVLHPVGYDALGLPAENAAVKVGTHPEDYTNNSIPNFMKQQKGLGLSYDWSRMINTADPSYYKWDQWIFLKMLEKGLAYQKEAAVNWCPKCNTVLANEQVKEGRCWIHDDCDVEVRNLKQWFLKTTEYADELYEGLDKMDWPEKTKAMQKNWIGKSHGTEIDFLVESRKNAAAVDGRTKTSSSVEKATTWPIFTTRPDTIFGVTFMVVSAQHLKLDSLVTEEQRSDVDEFLKKLKGVSQKNMKDIEALDKEGVFTGSYAVNPANGERVPVWAGNFVVADYGAGMVMAVPAHDQRDFEFAKKYGIEVKQVVAPCRIDKKNPPIDGKKIRARKTVHAIVKDGDKALCVKWKKQPWTAFVVGGIDEGEDIVDAARREVLEETGYKNLTFEKIVGTQMRGEYFAAHKDENRVAHTTAVIFNLENSERDEVSQEETDKHDAIWLNVEDINENNFTCAELDVWMNAINGEGERAYTGDGCLINSGEFDDLENVRAKHNITEWLIEKKVGRRVVNFKLRDWGVSRQRYWGTPIPIIHCEKCGAVGVPEKDLPVKLPKDVKFGDGNPLETNEEWLNVECPKCGGKGRRESDTMDTFVNSSWYFMRFCDSKNDKKIFDVGKVKHWCPIDFYVGGAEHACMHLIYSRFYVKFLRDLGLIDFDEPAVRLFHQGMINDEKGNKMSKSKGNVVEPLETMAKYGVDTTRYFLLSMASPDKGFNWSDKEIAGSQRFVRKVVEFYERCEVKDMGDGFEDSSEVLGRLNVAIKGVGDDIENVRLRAATIKLKELFNFLAKEDGVSVESRKKALKLLCPFCPHVCEEVWERLGVKGFISLAKWPKVDESKVISDGKIVDLNSKIIEDVRGIIEKFPGRENVYVYVMPFELDRIDVGKISEVIGKEVRVFAVNDSGKYDPEGKAKKAKPGKASVYVE